MLAETEPDDAELVAQARGGDRAAFARLVERHYDFVHRIAWRWCGRKADAEDIAQDVCVRLGRAISGYRGQGAFTTWLYALTLNAAKDFGRKSSREKVKTEAFAVHLLVEGGAREEDEGDRLWEAVRQLPAKQCEAVMLVYGEEKSHAEAADMMNCAEATVSWHIHEAKKRLRQSMRPAGDR